MNQTDNRPVVVIFRSGPDTFEQERLRRMVLEEGATVDELVETFRDVEPGSLEAWHRSLQPPTTPKRRPAEPEQAAEGGDEGGDGPAAEQSSVEAPRRGRGRKAKVAP